MQAAGIAFLLFEARDRVGGRVQSVDDAGAASHDGFDLGASWFWPERQPAVAALVAEFGLVAFPQDVSGDVVVERMSRERPRRYRPLDDEPQSMRLAAGAAPHPAADGEPWIAGVWRDRLCLAGSETSAVEPGFMAGAVEAARAAAVIEKLTGQKRARRAYGP